MIIPLCFVFQLGKAGVNYVGSWHNFLKFGDFALIFTIKGCIWLYPSLILLSQARMIKDIGSFFFYKSNHLLVSVGY